MTVWDNIAFGLVERSLDRETINRKVGAMLDLVGLAQYARRHPYQLSGGQQQRVALARTLVVEPQVLLLDEPLSNLDKKLRVQMRAELRALQRELGITTLFVTHDQEEAMTIADRMAVLDRGEIQQLGTPAALFDYPANAFVAGFVGTANLLTGEIDQVASDMVRFRTPGIGEIVLPKHPNMRPGRLAISFRPHTIRMTVGDAVRDGAYIWLTGTVEQHEFLGEFTRYRVRVGDATIVADQAHFSGMAPFAECASVALGIDATQIRYLQV
jgi:iron(III) transport system ATP-binding protein